MSLTIELPAQRRQTAFNLRRWREVLEDPEAQKWVGRVETDRHGQMIMSPPPAPEHGFLQGEIVYLLRQLLPEGHVISECPISTADGVRAADVAWISAKRKGEITADVCFKKAPEICVEVHSPRNTQREMAEKKALYFAAGALEAWFCDRRKRMTFFTDPFSEGEIKSRLCPEFPGKIDQ